MLRAEMKRRLSIADEEAETNEDYSTQHKRERRKARKVIVERLRRERIDRSLEELKLWLQDSTPSSSLAITQDELSNLEKADILELTVTNLRQMVANTQLQYSIGYSACVQEVDQFLSSFRFDDVTRRRIVQHLCRRVDRVSVSGTGSLCESRTVEKSSSSSVENQHLHKSSSSSAEYQHLRMCSYNSGVADSTTGSSEMCEPSTTLVSHDVIADVENQPTEDALSITSTQCCHAGGELSSSVSKRATLKRATLIRRDSCSSDVSDVSSLASMWRPW